MTPDGPTAHERLIRALREHALVIGEVVLTSGRTAQYLVDAKRAILRPAGFQALSTLVADQARDWDATAVGGMTMGADPIAAAILHQGAARGESYDAFVVRKEPKDHGRGKQVEGPDLAGRRVIVLEDTSTTGGSPMKAIEALLAVGAEIAAVAVVVDRNTGAREVIESAGYPYFAAIGLEDLGLA